MPSHYLCRSPWCKAEFESLTATNMCPTCFGTQVIPTLPPGPVDTFPAPGGAMAVPVVRFNTMGSGYALRYKVTDETDRSLTIVVNSGAADTEITVPAGRVVQNPAGQLDQWSLLNRNGQPDWAHFGSSKFQESLKNMNERRVTPFTLPRSAPIYLRLGFQNRNEVHSGFGFIHILFSHGRKSFDAVVKDMQKVLTATIGMDSKGGQGRVFSSGTRFLLTCEIKGGKATQLVVDERDGVYNFITMFDVRVRDLSASLTAGNLRLLWPSTFSPR
jgi:hypothetical protein